MNAGRVLRGGNLKVILTVGLVALLSGEVGNGLEEDGGVAETVFILMFRDNFGVQCRIG